MGRMPIMTYGRMPVMDADIDKIDGYVVRSEILERLQTMILRFL